MATKKVTYVEPEDYFSPSMRKAADAWDKKNADKLKPAKPAKPASKGKTK